MVFGMVGLHRGMSEWSAQGLGGSAAALVEAGWRAGRGVVVMEEKEDGGGGRGWEESVPMLSGSVRRAELEGKDEVWSGRTVEIRRILGRWFKFRSDDRGNGPDRWVGAVS